MAKDAAKYKKSGGWGYARWVGIDQKPYGKLHECFDCHQIVEDKDYVFSKPAKLP